MNTTYQLDTTEELWSSLSEHLRSFILSQISNNSAVDDILQDIFLKIHSKIDTLQDKGKLKSWVFQIARNSIIDYHRNTKKEHISVEDFDNLDFNHDEEESFDNYKHKSVASGLIKIVDVLPEKYAQAVLKVDFEGLSQKQLAEELGISISGAKSRVQRGRKMLKDSLMQCCHFQFDKYGTVIDSHPIRCCCCNES